MTVKPWTFVGTLAAAATLSLASNGFGQCGTGGSCCEPQAGPFCNDVTCCEAICSADPFCCDTQWDQLCANAALAQCTACGATTCPVDCSSANAFEDEFCGDDINGGCNSFGTSPIAFGDIVCGNYWAEGNSRDTDWYEFSISEGTVVTVTLQGSASLGSVLFLVDGNCPPAIIASTSTGPGDCSTLTLADRCLATPGSYRIVVATNGFNGVGCDQDANYLLSLTEVGECQAPPGDECDTATAISTGDTPFDTAAMITSSTFPECNFFGSAVWNKDIWFKFSPPEDGLYRFSTCNQAGFDTRIAVLDSCFFGTVLGCNDDATGCAGFTSEVLVPLTAGFEYFVSVGGFGASSGSGILTVAAFQGCDTDCPTGAHIEQEFCGDDTNGGCNGFVGNEPIGNLITTRTVCGTFWAAGGTRDTDWFEFNLPEGSVVTMTAQSTFGVTIGLLSANCAPFIYVIDGTQACGATITACLPAGPSVAFIARNAFDGPPCGSGQLNEYTFTLTRGEACTPPACGDADAGDCCTANGTPFCSDELCCSIICSQDPFCCDTEWDTLCAQAAVQQCDACFIPPPDNDECSGAITANAGINPFSNQGAQTGTDNGPSCLFFGSSVNNNDVWFKYTATENGEVTVNTCGQTTLDTKLSVFANCGDFNAIACNDDFCGLQSSVTFNATTGTTYYISVGAFSAAGFGSGTFTITAGGGGGGPVNDNCSGALVATVGSNAFTSVGATTDTVSDPALCTFFGSNTNYNDVWFAYTATGNGTCTITTCGGTTLDTKMSVFSNCDLTQTIACNDDATGCGLQSRVTFTPTCGVTYYISIGAYSATGTGAGTFTITQDGTCGPPPNPADLNGDGVVNAADLTILLGAWGTSGPGDINGDGVVNAADLTILLGAWS